MSLYLKIGWLDLHNNGCRCFPARLIFLSLLHCEEEDSKYNPTYLSNYNEKTRPTNNKEAPFVMHGFNTLCGDFNMHKFHLIYTPDRLINYCDVRILLSVIQCPSKIQETVLNFSALTL